MKTPDPNTSAETIERMKALGFRPHRRTMDKLVTGYISKGDILPLYVVNRDVKRRWWIGVCRVLVAQKYLSFTRIPDIETFDSPEGGALWVKLEKANG